MRESELVVETLKAELRRQGRTYQDLVGVLDLSHASIKRLFADRAFTLERLEVVCRFLGIDMAELFRLTEKKQAKLTRLTVEQEQLLVGDTRLLCVAHALLQRWTLEEVLDVYAITEHEAVRLLAKLDKLKVIELLPGNRYKLLVSRKFQWLPNGPIQTFFEKQLQADFLASSFNQPGERRLFVSVMLSRGSIDKLDRLLMKTADEINELHLADEALPLAQRRGLSVALAMRPWEAKAFTALRRKPGSASSRV
jgi:transcriptional regulator with XRE-family HTH domain